MIDESAERKDESVSRTIWKLAWPVVALNSLQVVNSLLDRYFLGHLGAPALEAMGGSLTVVFLLFSLAMALSGAATALVSRNYGAKNYHRMRVAARQCLSVSIMSGIILSVVGIVVSPYVAAMTFKAGEPAIKLMTQYLSIFAIGLPAMHIVQCLAGSSRATGDSKSPMVLSGIQILLHIILNYILIFPPRMGPLGITIPGANMGFTGAAVALSTSAWMAALGYMAYSSRSAIGSAWQLQMPRLDWLRRIVKIAAPNAGMAILRVGSLFIFTQILKNTASSSAAIGGMSIAFSLESIMFMPAFGLSMASAALVGQSLGAKEPERAERIGWLASHYGALVVLAMVVPIYIGAGNIAGTMISSHSKPAVQAQQAQAVSESESIGKRDQQKAIAVREEATKLVRILCYTEVFFSYAMILIGAMQGAGDTIRPFWLTVVCLWGVRVPLAYLLAITLQHGAVGAYWSMSITQALQGMLSIVMFRAGRWKSVRV